MAESAKKGGGVWKLVVMFLLMVFAATIGVMIGDQINTKIAAAKAKRALAKSQAAAEEEPTE